MPRVKTIVAVSLHVHVALSIPMEAMMGASTFTLEQSAYMRESPWTAAMSMRRTAQKYGVEVPDYINEAAEKDAMMPPDQTSVPAKSSRQDIQYLINVQVGNHNLSLDLDTGSSDLWVVSTLLPSEQRGNRQVSRLYDPNSSKAKELQGHSWSIHYGDKSRADGAVYLDNVIVGSLTVPNQAVQAASNMSRIFLTDGSRDGLFGFGFSKLNTIKPARQLTWFDNIRPKLKQPVFTSALKRRATGSFDFGFVDKSKYKGDVIWANVDNSRGHWGFKVSGFSFGNGPMKPVSINAIADTGSSIWYVPNDIADGYWQTVPGATFTTGQGGWVFPCSTKLPDIGVHINGKKVTVPGINLNYRNLGANCMGGLQRDLPMPFSIFGDTFMKNQFVIHEAPIGGQARIGFAAATDTGT